MSLLRNSVLVLSIGLGSLGVASCGTSYVSTKTADPVLLEGQDVSEVRAAIVRAMKKRKFKAERDEPGVITARFDHGDEQVEVAIEYSGTQYVIRYLASQGLETADVDGEIMIEKAYDSYKRKLSSVIDKELQQPAKDRAEAERDRRDYELMLARAKAGTDRPAAPAEPSGPDVVGIIGAAAPLLPQGPAVEVGGSVRHSEQSLTCCINGSKYLCPGQDAFNQCITNGPSACKPAGGC